MKNRDTFIYLAWMIAALSTAGSFFFSSFMKLPPCDLCWYQRIFMFPLAIILGVGFSIKDKNVQLYSIPLILIGWLISLYHNLLYYKWISPTLAPCTSGVSCTERQLDLFGFLSIPLMSFISFTILLGLMLIHYKQGRISEKN